MKNRIYISPYDLGFIKGGSAFLSQVTEVFVGRASNTTPVYFVACFQAGVDELLVDEEFFDEITENPLMKERAKSFRNISFFSHKKLVDETLSRFLPENYDKDKKFADVNLLSHLIANLCVALKHGVGLLTTQSIPEPESFRGILPPELLVPVSGLLSCINKSVTAGPLPRYEILAKDLRLFQEIFETGLFHDLSGAHTSLSDQEATPESVLHQIRHAASRLQAKYASQLRLSRFGVSLLPVIPKLVDETFGSFPGKIAESLTILAQPYLQQRRRVVVYDTSHLTSEIAQNMMLYVMENRDEMSKVDARLKQLVENSKSSARRDFTKTSQHHGQGKS